MGVKRDPFVRNVFLVSGLVVVAALSGFYIPRIVSFINNLPHSSPSTNSSSKNNTTSDNKANDNSNAGSSVSTNTGTYADTVINNLKSYSNDVISNLLFSSDKVDKIYTIAIYQYGYGSQIEYVCSLKGKTDCVAFMIDTNKDISEEETIELIYNNELMSYMALGAGLYPNGNETTIYSNSSFKYAYPGQHHGISLYDADSEQYHYYGIDKQVDGTYIAVSNFIYTTGVFSFDSEYSHKIFVTSGNYFSVIDTLYKQNA